MTEERSVVAPPNTGRTRLRWHFANAVLDERTFELVVAGTATELERKPLEVLNYLLLHAGEVCTKDELLAGVWPGRVLSETVLTKCIGRLREALGDDDQQIIKTAYGFGYRFAAPVRIESEPTREPSRFDFRPGDHPPGRPLWSLVERLGVGGHGEAWRAHHDKTNEQRVFKFALDEHSLGALKREITLFRVINDTVGTRARVVRLLDWNLETLPYFVEAEFVAGGSLIGWARARGGIGGIPLEERLEVVARLAEALSAVHAVGVLHKDLKPSNVLIRPYAESGTEVLLADFGSGGVLDVAELERLGITRLGFTMTVASAVTSATPMYLAPEILAGQPFTVKADIYALGMILYQVVVGDFNRLMSPGWERDVSDELLRQDIASLAEGEPGMRPGSAELVARNIRSLPERREQLRQAREAEARAERTQRLLERARARRLGLMVAFATLLVGLVLSTFLFLRAREARSASEIAAARSQAVTEFVSKDVFEPVSSGVEPVKELRVIELLERAGKRIDSRFARQPEVASELHYIIGRSLNEFYETGSALTHFNRALELGRRLHGEGSIAALRSATELVELDYTTGKLPANIARYEDTLAAGRATLPATSDAVLQLRRQLAFGRHLLGEWQRAAQLTKALLADVAAAGVNDPRLRGRTNLMYGKALTSLAQAGDADPVLRSAIRDLSDALGANHGEVAEARDTLGRALTIAGKYDEARLQLDEADALARRWEPDVTWRAVRPRLYKAFLDIEIGRVEDALPTLRWIVNFQDEHAGQNPELDHTGIVRQALGEILLHQGQVTESIAVLEKAVRVSELADGMQHPNTRSIRLSLADALLAAPAAESVHRRIEQFASEDLRDLPALHPFAIQRDRIRGLLALHDGNNATAAAALQRAVSSSERLYGSAHWRTAKLQTELLRATR